MTAHFTAGGGVLNQAADGGVHLDAEPAPACTFDAQRSSDPDGTIVRYAWDFGDGTTGTGATPVHVYASRAPTP